jgi:hypothetical protein
LEAAKAFLDVVGGARSILGVASASRSSENVHLNLII